MNSFPNTNLTHNHSTSDETAYMTVSSAPPKRRAGRTKFRETRHPIFKGVRQRNSDRWVCEVREPNKKTRIWLGTIPPHEMRAGAAIALRGRSACLNFADSPARLPIPESSSPRDIQRAAVAAAEAFRPGRMEAESSSSAAAEMRVDDPFCMELGMVDYYLDMAEGMLIDPPPMPSEEEGDGSNCDVSLWSHSF
ncbi:dehydration-responsive element-binding protein 1G-like [Phalaenopsis equestris]|uniref:dehydration-responsive element-binding protein 1G-like n=1 Tax=Phalaenopsis equestris TaxID=78828 RepID=UPI0009E4ED19|nr:dehydration-responsive element-binding protein 1G-like [Phalaenopsis equestris]